RHHPAVGVLHDAAERRFGAAALGECQGVRYAHKRERQGESSQTAFHASSCRLLAGRASGSSGGERMNAGPPAVRQHRYATPLRRYESIHVVTAFVTDKTQTIPRYARLASASSERPNLGGCFSSYLRSGMMSLNA